MGIVKSDLLGNADSLWRLHTPGATLQHMCDAELEALGGGPGCRAAAKKASRRDGSACTSLLWLCRALRLIEALLLELVKPLQASLKECVTAGYAHSLRKHHNALVRYTIPLLGCTFSVFLFYTEAEKPVHVEN